MLKRLRYWLEWFFVKILAGIIPLLPLALLRRLARFAGAVVYRLDRKSRAVALANLEAVFGDTLDQNSRERIACESLQVFARAFLELFWVPRLNKNNVRDYVSFEDTTRFNKLIARPAIMITCHFGNFEWASALFGLEGYSGTILTQRFKNDRLTSIFRHVRELPGNIAITQENSILRLFKALRKGRPIGILTDLTLKMDDPAVIIDAFGRKMRVTLAHCILHERTGIPIVPFIALPLPSESCLRYHSQLDHLINRSPKRAGTNLNLLFGSIRSNGCGSTNIGDIARQLLITNIRSTRTVQPVSMKSWENDLTHPFGASSSASGIAQKRQPLSLQISTIR